MGGLVPENGRKIDELMRMSAHMVYGSPEWQAKEAFVARAIAEDDRVWESWSPAVRRSWVARRIRAKREQEPAFANCGDKFLTDE